MKAEEIRVANEFLNNLYGIGDKDHETGLDINHYLGAISDLVKQNKELIEIPVKFLQWIIDYGFETCDDIFFHKDDTEGENPLTPEELYHIYENR